MPPKHPLRAIVLSSSAGTVIEWYDFYIFGTLTVFLSAQFFPKEDATAGLLSTLAVFASGFAARPFGALVFGRIGDRVGRKYAFLLTLLLMGGATFLIGVLPTYSQVGLLAPALLTLLRLVQGLALGGEYGGAAVYVAEHAPEGKRGLVTSFIQTTASLGLFLALGVILATRTALGDEPFRAWGWRIPFLLSAVLMGLSVYIRLSLHESPLFQAMKAAGRTSHAPLTESFTSRRNWKVIGIAFFGAAAGQAAIFYAAQFYALLFLQTVLKVEYATAYTVIALALAIATPGFIVAGWLSDRVGRKPVMMAGNLLAAVGIYPVYKLMATQVTDGVANVPGLVACVVVLVFFVTLSYGPIAAWLVEAFPARIRYTSLSLPYHVANGYIGGFTPLIATALQTRTGDPYAGLWWPIGVAAMTFVVGSWLLPETRDARLWEEALGTAGDPPNDARGPHVS